MTSAEDGFDWSPYLATPWAVPPVLVTNLVRALADDWPSERRDAAYALGVVLMPPIDDRVADELIYSLADPSDEVRLAAVRALGRLRATRAGDQLDRAHRRPGSGRSARRHARPGRDPRAPGARGAASSSSSITRTPPPAARRWTRWPASPIRQLPASSSKSGSRSTAEHRRSAYEGMARLGGVRDADAAAVEQRLTEERDAEVRLAMAFALAAARPSLSGACRAVAVGWRCWPTRRWSMSSNWDARRPDALVPYLQDREPVVRARVAIAAGFAGGPLDRNRAVPVDQRRRPVGATGR